MGKNVAVFVDVANIFYAAKAAGADIDYVLLLKAATAGRDLVRAYAYTGLDPENENQRNFHSFLARHDFKVVSKDIRKYGDGKVKANLDIELVVDMMKTSRNLDVAVVVSGDGDFAPAIRAVQEMGVRVEVISFRGNTSSDLIEVADKFTDITQLAKVERASTASGRRVASDEEDLSMTEVPEKESEGTGRGRGRGRVRSRVAERPVEAAPVRAGRDGRARGERAERPAERVVERIAEAPVEAAGAAIVALPGERLAKARRGPAAPLAEGAEDEDVVEVAEIVEVALEAQAADGAPLDDAGEGEGEDAEGQRRRRRRRGGRGRGRGRAREEGQEAAPAAEGEVVEEEPEAAPRPPRPAAFGSIWDSQIGVPSGPVAATPGSPDEEFDDEPEIPEYLLAEQRRNRVSRDQRGRGAPRGRGGAYAAAVDRERYGSARTGSVSRYSEPASRPAPVRSGPPPRDLRRPAPAPRQERPRVDRPRGEEPWSEVPPELEEMLRAQFAQKTARAGEPLPVTTRPARPTPARAQRTAEAVALTEAAEPVAETPKRRTRRPAGATVAPAEGGASAEAPVQATAEPAAEAPKRRTRRAPGAGASASSPDVAAAEAVAEAAKPRTRRTTTAPEPAPAAAEAASAAPKRRTRKAVEVEAPAAADAAAAAAPAAAPKRRTRKAAAPAD